MVRYYWAPCAARSLCWAEIGSACFSFWTFTTTTVGHGVNPPLLLRLDRIYSVVDYLHFEHIQIDIGGFC